MAAAPEIGAAVLNLHIIGTRRRSRCRREALPLTGQIRPDAVLQRPANSLNDLVDYFRSGHTTGDGPSQLVGMEVEFASVIAATAQATPYDGDTGIRALLMAMAETAGLEVHRDLDSNEPIGLGPPPGTTSGSDSFFFSIVPVHPGRKSLSVPS